MYYVVNYGYNMLRNPYRNLFFIFASINLEKRRCRMIVHETAMKTYRHTVSYQLKICNISLDIYLWIILLVGLPPQLGFFSICVLLYVI